MIKTLITGMTLLLSISSFADYRELPRNLDDLKMNCDTFDNYDSDEMEQSLEKFSISTADENGIREVSFNNSKQSYACSMNNVGLLCEGQAYQVNDDQLLEDTDDSQKFEVSIQLDYRKHRSDLIEGIGKVPSGFLGVVKSRDLYCEIIGDRKY
jgi:plasmid rolling circle replication initiator protein Rep